VEAGSGVGDNHTEGAAEGTAESAAGDEDGKTTAGKTTT
jgi:hypothetical protein